MEHLEERGPAEENLEDRPEIPERSWKEIAEEICGRIENPVGPEGTTGETVGAEEIYRQAWITEAQNILARCDDRKARKMIEKKIKEYQK